MGGRKEEWRGWEEGRRSGEGGREEGGVERVGGKRGSSSITSVQNDEQLTQTFISSSPQLKVRCPRLAEITSVAVEVISETSFSPSLHRDSRSVRFLMEGLFAHFFSPYRRGYDTEDVQWFLELANEQEQWGANPLEHSVVVSSLSDDLLESAQHQLHEHPAARTEVSCPVCLLPEGSKFRTSFTTAGSPGYN